MKFLLSIITLSFGIYACNPPIKKDKDKVKVDHEKELLEADRKLLESEKKLLELEKINLENSKIASDKEAKFKENNRVVKNKEVLNREYENSTNIDYYSDAESTISDFLSAENARDFEYIYSFYSPYLRRYFGLNNPTYTSLQNLYTKSWKSNSYSKNTVVTIDQIVENEFLVRINYEWERYSDPSKFNSKYDNLKFVLDDNNKIIEVYSIN